MAKNPTSIRLTEENEAKLKAIAKREGITLSNAINRLINSFSGERESKPIQSSEINAVIKRLETIEKELSLQRQRMNIFKNQVDFIIKSKNGRYKQQDRYSKDNNPKQSLDEYKK